jgi:tRNA-uridine 2-sulfurtransferase
MSVKPHVVVAMSGGVDSSVAAALLVNAGYQVTGIMLRLWSEESQEENNRCCTPDALSLARRVAASLNIPFYVIDAKTIFYKTVVKEFIDGYAHGSTPNPCLSCNKIIRWGFLLDQAIAMDAQFLATGHYARLSLSEGGKIALSRGVDLLKDQSYVLALLNQKQLTHTILPLGDLKKIEVRKLARDINLPVADRSDSQDLCFLSGRDYRSFLARNHPGIAHSGYIMNTKGDVIGQHEGLVNYTIGQRKGIRISSKQPYYVIQKDVEFNQLIVGTKDELGQKIVKMSLVNWINEKIPDGTFHAMVQIRYKAKELPAMILPYKDGTAEIIFDNRAISITPGQAAVVYENDVVICGGIIQ